MQPHALSLLLTYLLCRIAWGRCHWNFPAALHTACPVLWGMCRRLQCCPPGHLEQSLWEHSPQSWVRTYVERGEGGEGYKWITCIHIHTYIYHVYTIVLPTLHTLPTLYTLYPPTHPTNPTHWCYYTGLCKVLRHLLPLAILQHWHYKHAWTIMAALYILIGLLAVVKSVLPVKTASLAYQNIHTLIAARRLLWLFPINTECSCSQLMFTAYVHSFEGRMGRKLLGKKPRDLWLISLDDCMGWGSMCGHWELMMHNLWSTLELM